MSTLKEALGTATPAGIVETCVHCGEAVDPGREWLCNNCGQPFALTKDRYAGLVEGNPPTIVRTYRGSQQADTAAPFRSDAAELAKYGYAPTTQSWAQGQWGGGAFLVALLLCIVLIGILVFIYMLIVKPEGTLTVTYAKAGSPATETPPVEAPATGPLTLSDRLAQLDEARASGLVTPEEYEAKRAEVLKSL
jgi:Short C-terminal domain